MGERFLATLSVISLVLSCLSTIVAGLTAFFTLFRRPRLRMTQPTMVALAFEGSSPKVFLRTCLYSTRKPGVMVENVYVRLFQGPAVHTFSFWGYGDSQLVRGSGLFAPPEGVSVNHHFVLPKGSANVEFEAGPLTLEVVARTVGNDREQVLCRVTPRLSEEEAAVLNRESGGVMFDWHPDSGEYIAEVDHRPTALRRA
jgi:hypothetical protein